MQSLLYMLRDTHALHSFFGEVGGGMGGRVHVDGDMGMGRGEGGWGSTGGVSWEGSWGVGGGTARARGGEEGGCVCKGRITTAVSVKGVVLGRNTAEVWRAMLERSADLSNLTPFSLCILVDYCVYSRWWTWSWEEDPSW